MSVEAEQGAAAELVAFLRRQTGHDVAVDRDIFADGVVTSLFAMQLVIHLEERYGVRIAGADLTMENFRTIRAMAALVTRLGAVR